MHIRCPHCQNAIEVIGDVDFVEVMCPSCGSSFNLLPPTESYRWETRTIRHFALLEPVGAGGFGTVWKAHDTQLDRFVAVKIPRRDQIDPSDAEQFLREARAAAQLRHPQIVAVHEVGRENDTLYIVSDFVQGVTLADWLTVVQPSAQKSAKLVATVAVALQHAHEAGVIHRDLKPSNIMLDGDEQPYVMDFGLAKRETGEITVTVDGKILGTPAYMSPEQARGECHHVDRRTDIYSLGVILFELLTGERPFGGNRAMIINQVLHAEPKAPRKLRPKVPLDLETICLKCLQKVPAKRYSTAQELGDDLERFLAGKPVLARRTSILEKLMRWAHREPRVAVLSLSACLLSLTVVGLIAALWNRPDAKSSVKNASVAPKNEARDPSSSFVPVPASTALRSEPRNDTSTLVQQASDGEIASFPNRVSFVPAQGSAITKTPRFVEIRADGYTAQPERKIYSPVIPLGSEWSVDPETKSLIDQVDQNREREYLLLLVHPNGCDNYRHLRRYLLEFKSEQKQLIPGTIIRKSRVDVGAEPFDPDWEFVTGGEGSRRLEFSPPRSGTTAKDSIIAVCEGQRVSIIDYSNLSTIVKGITAEPHKSKSLIPLDGDFALFYEGTDLRRFTLTVVRKLGQVGETRTELKNANSRFRNLLMRSDPAKHYIDFIVYSDSFEAFRGARRFAQEMGFDYVWGSNRLGEPIKLGPGIGPVQ